MTRTADPRGRAGTLAEDAPATTDPRDDLLVVSHVEVLTIEDDFERGEVGRVRCEHVETTWSRPFTTWDAMMEWLRTRFEAPDDRAAWQIYAPEHEPEVRLEASWLVNETNLPATEAELADWKRGDVKLYAMRLSGWVTVMTPRRPDAEGMARELGLELVR